MADDASASPRHQDDYDPDVDADLTIVPPPADANVPEIAVTSSSPTSTTPSRMTNATPTPTSAFPGQPASGVSRRTSQLRRAARDNRAANRLSGFFSNLFHGDAAPSKTLQNDVSDTPPLTANGASSRPATPPPPALPPPSLADLGLTLSPITASLSSTHPSSGTFLAPNFLLLCHQNGLDVLPLAGPSQRVPLNLIRRVPFKSAVIMEERGVLVAIAGRRDAVRVYALEELRRLIDWRVDSEMRKSSKRRTFTLPPVPTRSPARLPPGSAGSVQREPPPEYTPNPPERTPSLRVSRSNQNMSSSAPARPTMTRPGTATGSLGRATSAAAAPPRSMTTTALSAEMGLAPSFRPRQPSVSTIRVPSVPVPTIPSVDSNATITPTQTTTTISNDKRVGDWMEDPDSDDEALLAAGPSGSAALDERTSAQARERGVSMDSVGTSAEGRTSLSSGQLPPMASSFSRPRRPSNLDLSAAAPHEDLMAAPPSPAPTLLTLRQALQHTLSAQRAAPMRSRSMNISEDAGVVSEDADGDEVDEGEDTDGDQENRPRRRREQISFAEALAESRLPTAPPLGSRSGPTAGPSDHVSGSGLPPHPAVAPLVHPSANMRRRWSVDHSGRRPSVSASVASAPGAYPPSSTPPPLPTSSSPTSPTRSSSGHRHRFLPRIITAAFRGSSSNGNGTIAVNGADVDDSDVDRVNTAPITSTVPPKLDFVKLPGTKGAIMVKAVETARKSFLAILCGDAGEKVELFAGTYKTALGLSRTFILPDSPRSLELQLQGDDLVEIFLVFGQNVFGLEPATVRVREVRIGRAERRARRRARQREDSGGEGQDNQPAPDEDVGVSVTVAVEASDEAAATPPPQTPTPDTPGLGTESANGNSPSTASEEEELMGPYTTFQQLSFAPSFPLATIADECIIPPSYPAFAKYKDEWEKDEGHEDGAGPSGTSSSQIVVAVDPNGLTPPGLPAPPSQPPTKWYYRDPKGVVQGPFKGSVMQGWYKDGYLPLDLPIRRDGETMYTLLQDLRAQSVDPTQPFRPQPIPLTPPVVAPSPPPPQPKPLLPPVSLLKQPRHFGPPALFFSSRGGHSTSIVDARGKSVLKGRLLWSAPQNQAGEVRRVEAFDVRDRAVVVALRRSVLEAVDIGDALLSPGDESRMLMPDYAVPTTATNRRTPFVWRIGTPLSPPPSSTPGHLRSESSPDLIGRIPSRQKRDTQLQGALEREMGLDREWKESKHSTQEEVVFLGREGDNVFFCEKSTNYYRVLRLAPSL